MSVSLNDLHTRYFSFVSFDHFVQLAGLYCSDDDAAIDHLYDLPEIYLDTFSVMTDDEQQMLCTLL